MAHQTVQIILSIAESTDCVNGENDCFHITHGHGHIYAELEGGVRLRQMRESQ